MSRVSEQVPLASPYYHRAPAPAYQSDPPTSKALCRFTADKSPAQPSWDTPIPCPRNAAFPPGSGVGGRVGPWLFRAVNLCPHSLSAGGTHSPKCCLCPGSGGALPGNKCHTLQTGTAGSFPVATQCIFPGAIWTVALRLQICGNPA